MPQNTVWISHS